MYSFKNNGYILKIMTDFFKIDLTEGENKTIKRLRNEKDVSLEKYSELFQTILKKEVNFYENKNISSELIIKAQNFINEIKNFYISSVSYLNLIVLKIIPEKSLAYINDKLKIAAINFFYESIIKKYENVIILKFANKKRENLDVSYIDDLKIELNEKSFNFLKPAENLYKSLNNFTKKKTSLDNILEIVNEIKRIKKLSIEQSLDIFLYLTLLALQQHLKLNLLIKDEMGEIDEEYRKLFNKNLDDSIKEIEKFKHLIDNFSIKEDVNKLNIELIENLYKNKSELQYQKDFYYAEFLEKINREKEALDKYMEVIEKTVQFDFNFLNLAINNGFKLARSLNDKRDKKIFNIGSYYGVIEGKYSDNNWMKEHYKDKYDFISICTQNGIPSCDDLRFPNAKYDYAGRKRTRLEIYSMIDSKMYNISEEEIQNNMKKLLEHGADINSINSTGETPLILAICNRNWDRALLLLEQPKIGKTIDQCSLRKKNTALLALINTFVEYPFFEEIPKIRKVFYKILEYNPNLNLKVGLDNGIYLRYLMNYLVKIGYRTLSRMDVRRNIDGFRRLGTPNNVVTDEDIINFYTQDSLELRKCKNEFIDFYNEKYNTQVFKDFIFELITELLNRGIDINVEDNKKISTIMFAAEIGDLKLFKLLEKHAYMYESKYDINGIYFNLYINALYYKNDEILLYIRKNYPSLATEEKVKKYISSLIASNYNKIYDLEEEIKIKIILSSLKFLEKDYSHLITRECIRNYMNKIN